MKGQSRKSPLRRISFGARVRRSVTEADARRIRSPVARAFDLNGGVTAILATASCWAPVVQTAIGAVAAIAGGAFVQSFARQQERRSVAAAFAGEIQCIVGAINWRSARKTIEQGKVPSAQPSFPIFEANVSKIGVLPVDLAGKVALFYSNLGGVFLDFRTLHDALVVRTIAILNTNEIKEGVLKQLDHLDSQATPLVDGLRKEAARRWRF